MESSDDATEPEIKRALRLLLALFRDGLRHGFFELSLRCELGKEKRRELTISSGKSHRFVISAKEVEREPLP